MRVSLLKPLALLLSFTTFSYSCEAFAAALGSNNNSASRPASAARPVPAPRQVPVQRPAPVPRQVPLARPAPAAARPPAYWPNRTVQQRQGPQNQQVSRPFQYPRPVAPFRAPQNTQRYSPAVRTTWTSGVSYERQARVWPANSVAWRRAHQQAYAEYSVAFVNLAPLQRIYTAQVRPDVYLGLAKVHLDQARELVFLGNPIEARRHIGEARFLLNSVINVYPQDPNWSWQTYYLLGDVNLYDDDVPDALADYQAASNMEPNFAPAAAMVQYLDQGGAVAQGPLPAPGPAPIAAQQQVLDSATPPAPAPPANPPVQEATNTAGLVQNMDQIQPPSSLVSNMSGISTGRVLEYAGAALAIVAALLGATELGTAAAVLGGLATIGGMAASDASKP